MSDCTRDDIALEAMKILLAKQYDYHRPRQVAKSCYMIANAMCAESETMTTQFSDDFDKRMKDKAQQEARDDAAEAARKKAHNADLSRKALQAYLRRTGRTMDDVKE